MEFKKLHYQDEPLLISNVWDAKSSQIAEELGFKAIGTSSAAIASLLGYKDGEELTFPELLYIVKRIVSRTNLPLTVDLESGYSKLPLHIFNHIRKLADVGVVGINIEDSIVNGERTLYDAVDFSKILSEVKENLVRNHLDIFINVRTDTFLLGHLNAVAETKRRISLYEDAGADGIFTPCIEKEFDIREIVSCTALPINVMCMPNLPNFTTLSGLGVKRISMGNFIYEKMYGHFESVSKDVISQRSFKPVF